MSVVDVVALLEELGLIDSQNPTLQPHSQGEGSLARFVAGSLAGHGIDVSLHEALPGRPNVVARVAGSLGAPTLLFEAGVVDEATMLHQVEQAVQILVKPAQLCAGVAP